MKNGRKPSNLVKSHELICHFIRGYLVPLPLPPYLQSYAAGMAISILFLQGLGHPRPCMPHPGRPRPDRPRHQHIRILIAIWRIVVAMTEGFLSSFLEIWFLKQIFEKFQDSENLCDIPQYDLHSIFGSCSSNHSDTHGTSNLNGGIANRTAGSMNQNCFTGLSLLIWNIRWIISVRQCIEN